MIRQEIIKLIQKATGEKLEKIEVEHPEDASHGDYSTNIALQLKKDPEKIAKKLKSDLLEKVEVAKPGFINFFLSEEYLQKQVEEVLKQKGKYGQLKIGKGQKVNVELVSANPAGPLHIGNGRNAFAGDVIANILEKASYKVTREYLINDAKNSGQIKELGKTALGKGTAYLTPYLKEKIKVKEKEIKKFDKEGEAGYWLAQEIQKDIKDFLENKLKIRVDKWISEENDIYKKNKVKKISEWLKKQGLTYEKEGAWWIKTSEYGAERDWVIVRETGESTYLLSDIAYHKDKFDRGFNKVIDIWGADHQAHVSKIKAAAKMLGFRGNLDILILQLVSLKGKEKLSKRKGEIITLEDLVNEIGLDTTRFFYLQKSLDTHMEIDIALAKQQSEKNPVYYVQYAHARICSIFRKASLVETRFQPNNFQLLKHPSELALMKQLIRLPEVVEDTAKDYQVQRLPQYATDLATTFHQFYRDCRVISDDKELTQARLSLALATKTALKNTLDLMGITAPEKM